MFRFQLAFCFILMVVLTGILAGCIGQSQHEVVVYAALDKEFSKSILEQFEKESGIKVLAKYDSESNKTVGHANEIIQTANKPRVDVFWNNEILHTLRLKKLGLLEAYPSPLAENYPTRFFSQEGHWHGFAARARVLIVNTDLLPDPGDRPGSVKDLVDPKWKRNCGMAKPLFGTTATHAAVLFDQWGSEEAKSFFRSAKANVNIESGNKQVALNVARGQYAWGITDTDDAIIELESGKPVVLVFPDQGEGQSGTLLIPNTLCVVKNGPNTKHAKALVDFLLRASVEDQLAIGRSAQIPLNRNAKENSRAEPETMNVMPVDFESAANHWEEATQFLVELFR